LSELFPINRYKSAQNKWEVKNAPLPILEIRSFASLRLQLLLVCSSRLASGAWRGVSPAWSCNVSPQNDASAALLPWSVRQDRRPHGSVRRLHPSYRFVAWAGKMKTCVVDRPAIWKVPASSACRLFQCLCVWGTCAGETRVISIGYGRILVSSDFTVVFVVKW